MDVTKHNLEAVLPRVRAAVQEAAFVGFDFEFTGLHTGADSRPDFFDTAEERYRKAALSVSSFAAPQIGLSCFSKKEGKWAAKTFNFHLFPVAATGVPDIPFLCSPSALRFLLSTGFDFNKWVADGISHFDVDTLAKLHKDAKNVGPGPLPRTVRSVTEDEKTAVAAELLEVDKWSVTADHGDHMDIVVSTGRMKHLVHMGVLDRFKHYHVDASQFGVVRVHKCDGKRLKRKLIVELRMQDIQRDYGFGRVLDILAANKPILVGHNMFKDSLHLVKLRYGALPESLAEFNGLFRELASGCFDTKVISSAKLPGLESRNTSLGCVFEAATVSGGWDGLASLNVLHAAGFTRYRSAPPAAPKTASGAGVSVGAGADEVVIKMSVSDFQHEAGYDAFITGFVFLRTLEELSCDVVSLETPALQQFLDKVFLLHTDLPHVLLKPRVAQPDPHRERFLFIVGSGKKGSWTELRALVEPAAGKVELRRQDANTIIVELLSEEDATSDAPSNTKGPTASVDAAVINPQRIGRLAEWVRKRKAHQMSNNVVTNFDKGSSNSATWLVLTYEDYRRHCNGGDDEPEESSGEDDSLPDDAGAGRGESTKKRKQKGKKKKGNAKRKRRR